MFVFGFVFLEAGLGCSLFGFVFLDMAKSVVKYAEGNAPCLSMHDCATLKSHIKCMAVGCELVDNTDTT